MLHVKRPIEEQARLEDSARFECGVHAVRACGDGIQRIGEHHLFPSGPRMVIALPFPQPQPSQCHTVASPAFRTESSIVVGSDGRPAAGEAVTERRTSGVAGRVAVFEQPTSSKRAIGAAREIRSALCMWVFLPCSCREQAYTARWDGERTLSSLGPSSCAPLIPLA